ncbi:serine/threonine-protein kinase [Cylindrospermopsis raciborskii]|uniref:serine/threonine-protein kinase n=1 Tax=Cylindrospermopsis raciborskii TaxID=77022 RepID=UPI001F3A479B|nr:serine/threonine-protein kinase [Cylindrospermopsis raciborskii]UJS06236.1 serine/threonine-protein kinase [Cylindrospermopsis raciborskii KLL07]
MAVVWRPTQQINNGRLTIQKVLGSGGFGITYKVTDLRGKVYALKTLNPTIQLRPDFQEQQVKFINEAVIAARFNHPHVLKVYEVVQEGELFAVLMEYIDGISLSNYIDNNGQLPENQALRYINQVGQALEHIHEDNYLHRDIKPDNILLKNNGQDAILIDFGLARTIATQSMSNSLTQGYAPIEQYQRQGNFGPHTDVYGLAATLYYLLTANGLRLEGKVSPVPALHRKYEQEELPEPKSYNPSISEKVNSAIMDAMAIDPERRTENIKEFRQDLGLVRAEPLPTKTPPSVPNVQPRERRDPITIKQTARPNPDLEKTLDPSFLPIPKGLTDSPGEKIWVGFAITGLFTLAITVLQYMPTDSPTVINPPEVTDSPTVIPTLEETPITTPSRYTQLETLLKAQNFREADEETARVMLAVANRQSEGWLRIEDAENFPCQELRTIDNLWLKYSQGKFGISVQQEIYKNLGGTKQFDVNVWRSFGDRVGWRKQGSWPIWLDYKDLNFSLSAPTGHLPTTGGGVGWEGVQEEDWEVFVDRLTSLLSRHSCQDM